MSNLFRPAAAAYSTSAVPPQSHDTILVPHDTILVQVQPKAQPSDDPDAKQLAPVEPLPPAPVVNQPAPAANPPTPAAPLLPAPVANPPTPAATSLAPAEPLPPAPVATSLATATKSLTTLQPLKPATTLQPLYEKRRFQYIQIQGKILNILTAINNLQVPTDLEKDEDKAWFYKNIKKIQQVLTDISVIPKDSINTNTDTAMQVFKSKILPFQLAEIIKTYSNLPPELQALSLTHTKDRNNLETHKTALETLCSLIELSQNADTPLDIIKLAKQYQTYKQQSAHTGKVLGQRPSTGLATNNPADDLRAMMVVEPKGPLRRPGG